LLPGDESIRRVPELKVALGDGVEDIQFGSEVIQIILVEEDGLGVLAERLGSPADDLQEFPLLVPRKEGLGFSLDAGVILKLEKKPCIIKDEGRRCRLAPGGSLEKRAGLRQVLLVQVLSSDDMKVRRGARRRLRPTAS
jgi:hypothetical protein